MNDKTNTQYAATLVVWSRIGHTPLTGRTGAYCDELARVETTVSGPQDALDQLTALRNNTPHADKGHYYIPELPNQNYRTYWL